jgi:hypothetical protein
VRCCFLDIAQRHPGIERGGYERVPQRVRPDPFDNPGAAGDTSDDPPCAVPVQPPPRCGQEDRAIAAFPDGQELLNDLNGSRTGAMAWATSHLCWSELWTRFPARTGAFVVIALLPLQVPGLMSLSA